MHRRVKRSEYRLIPKGYKQVNRYVSLLLFIRISHPFQIKRVTNAPNLIDPNGSSVQRFTKVCFPSFQNIIMEIQSVSKLFRNEAVDGSIPRWADTYKRLLKIKVYLSHHFNIQFIFREIWKFVKEIQLRECMTRLWTN